VQTIELNIKVLISKGLEVGVEAYALFGAKQKAALRRLLYPSMSILPDGIVSLRQVLKFFIY
jgi:hypothetical protein